MTMTRFLLFAALCALLLLTACGVFTPEQVASAEVVLRRSLDAGEITQAQFNAALEALHAAGGPDWATMSAIGVNLALNLLGVPAYVSWQQKRAAAKATTP